MTDKSEPTFSNKDIIINDDVFDSIHDFTKIINMDNGSISDDLDFVFDGKPQRPLSLPPSLTPTVTTVAKNTAPKSILQKKAVTFNTDPVESGKQTNELKQTTNDVTDPKVSKVSKAGSVTDPKVSKANGVTDQQAPTNETSVVEKAKPAKNFSVGVNQNGVPSFLIYNKTIPKQTIYFAGVLILLSVAIFFLCKKEADKEKEKRESD